MISKTSTCSGKLIYTGIMNKCFSVSLVDKLKQNSWIFDNNLLSVNIIRAELDDVYISSSIGSKIVSIHIKQKAIKDDESNKAKSQEIISSLNNL